MHKKRNNIAVLIALWIVTAGAGTYATFFKQPEALVRIDAAESALALERSEFRDLSLLEGRMREEIQFATYRWQARYKNIGDSLSTADVIAYVNKFADGFSGFNVEFGGIHAGPSHQYYAFSVNGTGPFNQLYDFVWQMENNRDLYRVEDLVIDRQGGSSGDVQFTFRLLAYFGTSAAVSATAVSKTLATSIVVSENSDVPMVPDDVLPARRLSMDPFAAAGKAESREEAGAAPSSSPTNLPSLRDAKFISIVGNVAVFDFNGDIRKVQKGDIFREGRVLSVDPRRQRVNVEGASGRPVHIDMEMEPLYRRMAGKQRATPVHS